MNTEIITSIEAAFELSTEWRELSGTHPFHSPEWNLTWFEHFGGDKQLCLIVTRDTLGNLVGLAPLVWSRTSLHGRLQFLGNGLACTDYTTFFAKGNSQEVIRRLVSGADDLLRQRRNQHKGLSSGRMELEGMLIGSPCGELVVQAMNDLKYLVRKRAIEAAYSLELPESLEALKSRMSRSLKRKLVRITKRQEAGELEFQRCNDVRQFDHLLGELVRLHQARRGMLGQPGVFADQKFIDFIKEVSGKLAERGQAEYQWCTINGSIVAMHLAFTNDNVISTYINGMDPGQMGNEPGFALVGCSIKDAIERGITTYDFLRGDEPYKQLWQAQSRPLERIYFTPNAVVPLLYDSAYALAGNVKHFAQNFWAH